MIKMLAIIFVAFGIDTFFGVFLTALLTAGRYYREDE